MFLESQEKLASLGATITTEEIRQQPELWLEAYSNWNEQKEAINQFINKFTEEAGSKIRVIFTGAGTSAYVGDTVVPFLREKGNTDQFIFDSIATTDIVAAPTNYFIKDQATLLISFARSGNSPESIAAVNLANQLVPNIRHLFITCNNEGQLAKMAATDNSVLLLLMPEKSNDQGFAMTGSFSCMTLTSLLIFDDESQDKESIVKTIVDMGHQVVEKESEIAAYVANDFKRVVYLGSSGLAGLAREAQLKILELTAGKIATCFDSSLGFRHGPKSFVDDQTLIFVFVANEEYTRQYDRDIINEIAQDAIAKEIVGITTNHEMAIESKTFTFDKGDTLPTAYLVFPYVMVAQTLSLHASVNVGNTPDTPSPTGTVNRVVKGVTIHPFN